MKKRKETQPVRVGRVPYGGQHSGVDERTTKRLLMTIIMNCRKLKSDLINERKLMVEIG